MDAAAVVADALAGRGYQSPESLDSLQLIELLLDIERDAGLDLDEADLKGPGVTTSDLERLVREAIRRRK